MVLLFPQNNVEQPNLFDHPSQPIFKSQQSRLTMDSQTFIQWKSRIFDHQQTILNSPPPQQMSLFDLKPNHCDPEQINPFSLRLQNWEFFTRPDDGDRTCIYFIIDTALPLLLYVGETKQTPKERWTGVHDCRGYIDNYIILNRKHQLKTFPGIGFWWDTPVDRKARQQLEQALIQRWKSPFNKECWKFWGKPFG
jgi:hypothetical protein